MNFKQIKKGDVVTRLLAGAIPMQLKVSEVTETEIICGAWKFDRETGAEIDEVLGWNKFESGSILKIANDIENKN